MYIHPLLASLPEATRKAVSAAAVLRSFRKNEIVLESGQQTEFVYCVGAGLLRVVSSGSGDADLTTHFLKPNEVHVGPNFTDRDYRADVTLLAALPSSVYMIPRRYLRRLCEAYPAVALGLLEMKLQRIAAMGRQMRRVATLSAEQIVGRALYDLTQEASDGTRVLDKRIPQSVIASYAGLSRPVVNRVIKEMEERGLLRREDQVLTLSQRIGHSTDFGELMPGERPADAGQAPYVAPDFDFGLDGPPLPPDDPSKKSGD